MSGILTLSDNINDPRKMQIDDVSTDFADDADAIMEIIQYGIDNGCDGDT